MDLVKFSFHKKYNFCFFYLDSLTQIGDDYSSDQPFMLRSSESKKQRHISEMQLTV